MSRWPFQKRQPQTLVDLQRTLAVLQSFTQEQIDLAASYPEGRQRLAKMIEQTRAAVAPTEKILSDFRAVAYRIDSALAKSGRVA